MPQGVQVRVLFRLLLLCMVGVAPRCWFDSNIINGNVDGFESRRHSFKGKIMDWKQEFETLIGMTDSDEILWKNSDLSRYEYHYKIIHLSRSNINWNNVRINGIKINLTDTISSGWSFNDDKDKNSLDICVKLYESILAQKRRYDLKAFWHTLGIEYDRDNNPS